MESGFRVGHLCSSPPAPLGSSSQGSEGLHPAPTQSRQGPSGPQSGPTDDPISTPTPRTVPVRLSRQPSGLLEPFDQRFHLATLLVQCPFNGTFIPQNNAITDASFVQR